MWTLFANLLQEGMFWHTSPNINIAKLYGGEVYKVDFVEDPDGIHYGWLKPDADSPTMVYPTEIHFSVCFPYGYKILEEQGEGRCVRLTATHSEKIA